MAKILIQSETYSLQDAPLTIEIQIDESDDELGAYGDCPRCGQRITDRGHLEDTIEAVSIHVEQGC